MNEIMFIIEDADEGGYIARALNSSIYTEADSLDELYAMIRDAVRCHYDESILPKIIRLHFIREEVIAV
jgi:hypothetical protein